MRLPFWTLTLAAVLGFSMTTPEARAQEGWGTLPYQDPDLPVDQRVEDLLARMTLEEKVAQMLAIWDSGNRLADDEGRFDATDATDWFRVGIGRIERPSNGRGARLQAEFVNGMQRWVRENTRLGIPVLFHEEALHGMAAPEATSFPQAIALASSWNPDLVERIYAVAASEVRARGAQQVLTPVVDIARDPRWGRIEETFGEDPYLVSRLGVAAVRGLQGAGPPIRAPKVIATLKHMTGHGQPQSGTNIGPVPFGERTLREFFFPPFEAAIREGGVLSVMPSYNEIDGIPAHTHRWMLRDVLRREWGFDGVIVSDWNAIRQLIDRHGVAEDLRSAARQSLEATVDIELPNPAGYATLVEEVREGRVPEAAIDEAVRRLLRAKFIVGLFEDPYVDPDYADRLSGSAEHRPLALEAARQGIILLKNEDQFLPRNPEAYGSVAVIGPHAAEVLLGGYSGVPRYTVSIFEGVRQRLGPEVNVRYAEGVRITEDSVFTDQPQPHMGGTLSSRRWFASRVVRPDPQENRRRIAEAVQLAENSELAIVVVGDNEQTAREAYADAHLGDRTELGLVGDQEALVRAVLATGTPTVLVLINGRPLSIPELVDEAPAILEGWYLGQETGTAVAEVVFGDVNPSGKLPLTVARNVGQVPLYYNHKPSALRGYLFDTTEPLFPFGFGLSYTTFDYSTPRVSPEQIGLSGRTTVSVDVTNIGDRAGDEIVQLYIRQRASRVTRPVMELKGFERIALEPGETRTVSFELGPAELSYIGPDMERVVEAGTFDVMVGPSSAEVQTVRLEVVDR